MMTNTTTVYQLFIFLCVGIYLSDSQTANQSQQLLNDALKYYNKLVRPQLNQSLTTTVKATFSVLKIHYLDEVEGRFSVAARLTLTWTDELIHWDPAMYGGITSHNFSPTKVWYPVYVLLHPEESYENSVKDWMTIRIGNRGNGRITIVAVYVTSCVVDITYYPFDIQTCSLKFVPWSYKSSEVNSITPKTTISMRSYLKHGEWDIEEALSSSNGYHIEFTFKLRRKPLFLVVNIIFPIILMSLLNTLIFVLPPQSGERVSYGITILLAIAVFLTLVGDNLPKTSNPMSILSFYLMINLTLSTMMCITVIFNIQLYYKESSEEIPLWARCVIQITCTKSCINTKQQCMADDYEHVSTIRQDTDKKLKDVLTWVDASKAVDRLCMVFFLLASICNTVTYFMMIVHKPSTLGTVENATQIESIL